MGKKRNKCYIIVGKKTKTLYGAFPLNPLGKKEAEKYLNKISGNDNDLEIREQ